MKILNEELLNELTIIEEEEIQIGNGFHSFKFSPDQNEEK